MPSRYRDIYPTEPLLESRSSLRRSATSLLSLEYFEAEPDSMPEEVFAEHHVLLNLKREPHRVENWRNGEHRDFHFSADEVVITPAGIRSGWRWHVRSRCIVITLEPERLEAFARYELGLVLTERQLRDVPQATDPDLCRAGDMLMEAMGTRLGSELLFESLSRVFLVKLIDRYGLEQESGPDFSASFSSQQYQKVLEYVMAHLDREIRLEDLARVAGISASHFSRLFKQTLGETPHQFVMSYRVEQAKQRLQDLKQPLLEVALSCGFSDQAHFTRVFRQRMGQTPRQWRLQPGT